MGDLDAELDRALSSFTWTIIDDSFDVISAIEEHWVTIQWQRISSEDFKKIDRQDQATISY